MITTMDSLKSKIRSVPDFPKAGILFYDITTLLRDRDGFRSSIEALATPFEDKKIDVVVGVESRGFILGGAVADRLGAGFAPVPEERQAAGPDGARDLRSRNTAPIAWRSTPMRSSRDNAC
jgi:adenine phosphoribosyltransferase